MSEKTESFYEFAGFRLAVTARMLIRQGEPVALTPKIFDTLLLLVQNSGKVLEKDQLMKTLWPDSFVEEGNLSQNIFVLRKILGDDRNGDSFIQTIPRRGYKFVASVRQIDSSAPENGSPGSSQSSLVADYWNCHSPFRSLQAFEPEDAWLFFGRTLEISELLKRVTRCPVLVVLGNSGCGKSSLIRAGLIPALQAGHSSGNNLGAVSWRAALFRPSATPFDYLADVLASQLAPELSLREQAEFIADCRNKFPGDQDALRNAVSALLNASMPRASAGQTHVLLVVDQFEEIFTLTSEHETRESYISSLLAASRPEGSIPIHLVLALRADFYAQCLEYQGLSGCLQTNLYNVPRMGREQLEETIERRLKLAAAQAEPGLIDSLLEDAGTEPGNLALLEHALGQLWDRCGSYGCTLTNKAYTEIGRLRGALGRHADEVYAHLGNGRLKGLGQRIFLELVHLGEDSGAGDSIDTRRRVPKKDLLSLGGVEEMEQLLARLASGRLISTGGTEQETFVEVSHEALIREWPLLREWIASHRDSLRLERRLKQAAQEWESVRRDPGSLLQGARLAQAEEWLARASETPLLLREFLQASIAARDESAQRVLATQKKELIAQRKAATRFRLFAFSLAALLLAALGMAMYIYRLRLNEMSRVLAAQAEAMWGRDQGQALDLAMRGWRIAKTEEARLAITKTFPQLIATLNHAADVESAVFSPDGQRMLTASGDHTARLWSSSDGRLLATLSGHTDKINYAEFSPDGERIVTASLDHTARIWNATDGTLRAVLSGHTDKVIRAQFSLDGRRVVTASWDHTARVWSGTDGRLLGILQGHTDVLARAIFSPDGLHILTASWDHTARVWSSTDFSLQTTLVGHTNAVNDAQFSPDGQRIVTCATDHTARVWKSDGQLLAVLRHDGAVMRATFSADGRRIATASYDHTAKIWDSADGKLLFNLQGHSATVLHASFSNNGLFILTDSYDSTARVWSSIDGQLLAILQRPTGLPSSRDELFAIPIFSAFSPDGRLVVTALGDPVARIWNIAGAGEAIAVLRGHTREIRGMSASLDGQNIATAGLDNTAKVWNGLNGHLIHTLQGHSDNIYTAVLSPDGRLLVTASSDQTARVWYVNEGRLLASLSGHTDRLLGAWFSPDSRQIVTAGMDHTARVWSMDGRQINILMGHSAPVWDAQFSPDGQRIVTASLDHTARIWNTVDGRLLNVLEGHSAILTTAQFSPDGQHIVTASWDHTARIWNSAGGRLLNVLEGHTDKLTGAQFSINGQRIATTGWDHTARIWSSSDGHLLNTLEGHSAEVLTAQFSPDGRYLVTSSMDRTARVWDAADGHLLAVLQGHTNLVSAVAFSADGQRVITASYDQTARIWRVITLEDIQQILAK